jgi:hypothetical protein
MFAWFCRFSLMMARDGVSKLCLSLACRYWFLCDNSCALKRSWLRPDSNSDDVNVLSHVDVLWNGKQNRNVHWHVHRIIISITMTCVHTHQKNDNSWCEIDILCGTHLEEKWETWKRCFPMRFPYKNSSWRCGTWTPYGGPCQVPCSRRWPWHRQYR